MTGRGARGGGRGLRWCCGLFLLLFASTVGAAPLVLSVDRLYRSDQSDLAEAGEILLTELHCVNCHQVPPDLATRIPVAPAPNIQNVIGRIRHAYLLKWLTKPHPTKRGSRMPDMLATINAKSRTTKAKALREFLISIATVQPVGTAQAGNKEHGRDLFHSIGCVACHQPRTDFKKTATGETVDPSDIKTASVPLGVLGNKYSRAGLLEFLRDPHAIRPAGRMPRIELSEAELVDLTGYLMADATVSKTKFNGEQLRLVNVGKKLFENIGCAACHDVEANGKKVASRLKPKPLSSLIGRQGGCLSKKPSKTAPWYDLDDFQRRALTSALENLKYNSPQRPVDMNHRRMVSLNCYACHIRKGIGGPDEERLKYFVSSGSDLGDEGRVPPVLTGVGRKMRHGAIEQVIQGRMPARPYMVTRMPDFGEAPAKFLAAGFAKADFDPNEKPTARDGEEFQVGRNLWGRTLLGTKGLSCITCHQLKGRKSLGIQSMDLAHSAKRLRPEWFRDYLIDPAKYRPGTRMPSFWPNGKPMLKGNGGSTARQIDSVWVYLNELDQSRLPFGLEKTGDFLLKPNDKPIVFRTFMKDVGMHAIAVGYPAATHAAFDSQSPRWAMAWTGKFLDAESTWDDRFTPLAKPEGTDVIAIQPGPPVHEQNAAVSFAGYQLHLRTGHPIFHYRVGGDKFTDVLLPDSGGGKRLTRTLTKTTGKHPKWIEIANGKSIVNAGADWKVDGRLKISTSAPARVVISGSGEHFQIRVGSDNGTGSAVVTYEW